MGICASDSAQHIAVIQDGEQHVKRTAILTQNQQFLEQYASQMRSKFSQQIKKRCQLLICQVNLKKSFVLQKYENKKLEMQSKQPGIIQKLQDQYNQPFLYLSGYDQTVNKFQAFQKRANQVHSEETKKLLSQVANKKEALRHQLQEQKVLLPNVNNLGLSKKQKLFRHYVHHNKDQVEGSNMKIQKQLDAACDLQGWYLLRIDNQVPKTELDQIAKQFLEKLESLTSQNVITKG